MRHPAQASPRAVGDVVDGRYQLLRDLGRGAAGEVFEARHLYTGRFVAVKMLLPQHLAGASELRARLQREGHAMASVNHPGVVDVLDGGVTADGAPYLVMEMLEGRTLEGLLAARTKLPIASSVGLALQLCDALAAVHRANIVHRDVKPSNIVVLRGDGDRERIKLLDFGIAKMHEPGGEKLTGIGAVIGTPAYMSPEQLLALDDVDHTTDVYSVGITMFECLSGTLPYPGNYPQVLLSVTADSDPPSLRTLAPEVPVLLAQVVDRAMAKSRASRYPTVEELARAIEAAVPGMGRDMALLGSPSPPRREPEPPGEGHRRRAHRAPYNTPVEIILRSGAFAGRTEDISEGGMLVLSRSECVADQRVEVRFAMPMDGKIVALEADVRWVRVASGAADGPATRAIGLEFVALPAATRAAIGHYVWLMSDKSKA